MARGKISTQANPSSSGAKSNSRKTIMTLDRLKHDDRQTMLDVFSTTLLKFLPGQNIHHLREDVMKAVNESLKKRQADAGERYTPLDARQFNLFMRALYLEGNLRVSTRTLSNYERQIRDRFDWIRPTVCAGTSQSSFAKVATIEVLRLMARIGQHKPVGEPLYIGLVSGSTTKAIIDELCASDDWMKDFGVEPLNFPQVVVAALNVSFTRPEYLPSHAMILAQALADAINRAAKKDLAKAYGLNAELIVEEERLSKVDNMPQTRDVLAFTEPYRVGKSKKEGDTLLDIVVTGVGQWSSDVLASTPKTALDRSEDRAEDVAPDDVDEEHAGMVAECSIFQNLVRGFEYLEYDLFREHHVVGDLGFTPLGADGHKVDLHGKDNNRTNYFVYTAARLAVLDQMVSTPNKAVVLVAQSKQEKNKIPILYASLAGTRMHDKRLRGHVSHLIIDEHTAQGLIHYSSTSLP